MLIMREKRTKINKEIEYSTLRVIDAEGSQLGIFSREDALLQAQEKELDLVLINEKAEPPVCKIINHEKYRFDQEKKAKEARKRQHQSTVKEVKMRYKIDEHDYKVRVR